MLNFQFEVELIKILDPISQFNISFKFNGNMSYVMYICIMLMFFTLYNK